jgi:tRNA threonylcarbamoyladenosine biosynthesis protein TsaB
LRHANRLIAVVIDARRKEVFFALYRPSPGGVQRVSEYEVGTPDDVAAELEARGEEALIAGDGALLYKDRFEQVDRVELAGPGAASPSAVALAELACARYEREDFAAPWDVHALYLRRSDAEIEWDRKAT